MASGPRGWAQLVPGCLPSWSAWTLARGYKVDSVWRSALSLSCASGLGLLPSGLLTPLKYVTLDLPPSGWPPAAGCRLRPPGDSEGWLAICRSPISAPHLLPGPRGFIYSLLRWGLTGASSLSCPGFPPPCLPLQPFQGGKGSRRGGKVIFVSGWESSDFWRAHRAPLYVVCFHPRRFYEAAVSMATLFTAQKQRG